MSTNVDVPGIVKSGKYVAITILVLYGLCVLVAGFFGYDTIYLLHSPARSLEKIQAFSLMLGVLSISVATLIAAPKTHRKKLTILMLLLAPSTIMLGEYAYKTQYRGAYAKFQDAGKHGHEQIARFNLAGKQESGWSLKDVNSAVLEQYKENMHGAREMLYSLPYKRKFEEGMRAANKEIEYFNKKQDEVNKEQGDKK